GMKPHMNESPVPKDYLTKNHIVFDVVYTPAETKLLQDAKGKGATVISGTEMFLEQAIAQFKLYTGHDAPIDTMRKALLK
ncbi:MAG TPA: shikimate dehydrogenase, partial [Patescibacteria group bacterium]|nr:shikimate dehydrogenase [Patescibacteria group bacterium]